MPIIQKVKDALHGHSSTNEPATTEATTTTQPTSAPTTSATASTVTPVFDHAKVTVIYVLGGPGVGKGTQCANLVRDYDFKHLSAGDLLRFEQEREGSTHGALIAEYIREGKVVPMEVTIKLLENAMRQTLSEPHSGEGWSNGKGRFLVDGFPRKMDQALKFDEDVCLSSFVLFFSCTEEVMLERLLERGKTSGRADDNIESIKKRFRTFVETSMPVIDYYRSQNKVVEVDSTATIEAVYEKVKIAMDAAFAAKKAQHQ